MEYNKLPCNMWCATISNVVKLPVTLLCGNAGKLPYSPIKALLMRVKSIKLNAEPVWRIDEGIIGTKEINDQGLSKE